MADLSPFPKLVEDENIDGLRSLLLSREFVLISVSDEGEGDAEDAYGALTAEIDAGYEALVVFTSEEIAGQFVNQQEDLFEDGEEVEGIVVEGDALLEYLPEGFGMLIDPEVEKSTCIVNPVLAAKLLEGLSTESDVTDSESGDAAE